MMLQILLKADFTDPNRNDEAGNTAIRNTTSRKATRVLIKAGTDENLVPRQPLIKKTEKKEPRPY
jgi:hypothetical protein